MIFSGKEFNYSGQLYRNMDHNLRPNKYNVSKSVVNLQVIKSSKQHREINKCRTENQVTNSKRHHNC